MPASVPIVESTEVGSRARILSTHRDAVAEDSGSFLVRTGLISHDEVGRLRRAAGQRGTTLFEESVLSGRVSDDDLTEAIAHELELRRVPANDLASIPASVIHAVPRRLCVAHRLIPTSRDARRLHVAISDPCDGSALEEVAAAAGLEAVAVLASQLQIAWCLAHYHGVVTPLGETLLERRPAPSAPAAKPGRRAVRPPTERNDDVELRPRAGEIAARPLDAATPASSRQDLPAVVLDDSLELRDALRRESQGEAAIPEPVGEDASDEIIMLTPEKRRRRSNTELGVAPVPASGRRLADLRASLEDDIATEPGRHPPLTPPDMELGDEPDLPDAWPPDDDDHGADPADLTQPRPAAPPTPEPQRDAAAQQPAPPADEPTRPDGPPAGMRVADDDLPAKGREFDLAPAPDTEAVIPDEDDDFGPPGTTIPPPYLGAIPQGDDDVDSGAIPIQAGVDEDEDWWPHEADLDLPRPDSETEGDPYAELDAASAELVQTLRALEASASRDEVIDVLVGHVARRFERAAFFVIKSDSLRMWSCRGKVREPASDAAVRDVPTLAEVAERARPFRGAITDDGSRAYFEAWLGRVPDEILAVPVSVRRRVVGMLYGDSPERRVFDEHLGVLARAAGDALERLLRARKRP